MGNLFDCETNSLDPDLFPKDEPSENVQIERPTRFGSSRLWEIQRRFYEHVGPRAWSMAIVPHMLSSNAYVARAYAKILVALLRDLFAARGKHAPNPSEPVYIIEVGAGHGKLGFLLMEMIKEFSDAVPTCGTASGYPFVLVLTDVAEANVLDMESKPLFKHYASIGVLDFAVVDATADATTPIVLRRSGAVLEAGKVANPVVALVNYVLDTLPQDVLRFVDGQPHLGSLSIGLRERDAYSTPDGSLTDGSESVRTAAGSEAPSMVVSTEDSMPVEASTEPRAASAKPFGKAAVAAAASGVDERVPGLAAASGWQEVASLASKLVLDWQWSPASEPQLAEAFSSAHPALPAVLSDTYAADPRFSEAKAVLVPIGGARLLHRVQTLSGGRYVMLAMDKGHVDARTILESDASPHVAEHGALSFMANFHCLAALHLASASEPVPAEPRGQGAPGAAAAPSASAARPDPEWPRPLCLRTEQSDGLVKVVLLAGGLARPLLRGLVREFRTGIVEGSPDDFAHLHRGVKAEVPKASTVLALTTAILRLSACDPDVFFKFREPIITHSAPTLTTPATQADMGGDADCVLQRHFHMHSDKDVAFEIGRVFMSLRDYAKAYAAFRTSQELCGRHRVTTHNMGICMYFLKDFASAEALLLDALEEDRGYESARIWLARTREAVATGGLTPQEIEVRRAQAQATADRLRLQALHDAQARLVAEEEDEEDDEEEEDEDDGEDGYGESRAAGVGAAAAAMLAGADERGEIGLTHDRDDDEDELEDEEVDEDDDDVAAGLEPGPFTGEGGAGGHGYDVHEEPDDDLVDEEEDEEDEEDEDEEADDEDYGGEEQV